MKLGISSNPETLFDAAWSALVADAEHEQAELPPMVRRKDGRVCHVDQRWDDVEAIKANPERALGIARKVRARVEGGELWAA